MGDDGPIYFAIALGVWGIAQAFIDLQGRP